MNFLYIPIQNKENKNVFLGNEINIFLYFLRH